MNIIKKIALYNPVFELLKFIAFLQVLDIMTSLIGYTME